MSRFGLTKQLIEAIPLAVVVTDREGRVVHRNRRACIVCRGSAAEETCPCSLHRIFGKADATAHQDSGCGEFPALRALGSGNSIQHAVFSGTRHDGTHLSAVLSVEPLRNARERIAGAVILIEQASREGRPARAMAKAFTDDDVLHSQRMQSIGEMASGIAHSFNNMLAAISSRAEVLEGDVKPGSRAQRMASEIRSASDSAAHVTRRLLDFSRKRVATPTTSDLNEIAAETVELLRHMLPSAFEINLTSWKTPLIVSADCVELQQVLVNLVLNARDAMRKGGEIRVATRSVRTRHPGSKKPGSYCVVEITDEGCGIPPELRARIFEPFFTTKPSGRGTGLGLAVARTVVEHAGGFLHVDSTVGKGSTFAIYLPAK